MNAERRARLDELGWATLAALLFALLIDAAVETVMGGSPVRWWVAGAVVLLGGVLALLWRRSTWPTRALAAAFTLLAALAFTAWRPGGLEQGLTLLRLPTATLLAGVTGLAVILAVFLVARIRFVPVAARWAAGIIALYAVAGFTLASLHGTPYAELLHGAGLWARLPFWLQGPFLGALVLLPVAALVIMIDGVLRMRAHGGESRLWASSALAIALVAGMAAAGGLRPTTAPSVARAEEPGAAAGLARGSGARPAVRSGARPVAKPSDQQAEPVDLGQIGDRLRKVFPIIEEADRSLPSETFAETALVRKVGSDPAALFRWVRDSTFLVPYAGVLRGDQGVLLDRIGGNLDRALLLYGLLRTAHVESRLARGTLTTEQASRVLHDARPIPAGGARPPAPEAGSVPDSVVTRYAREFQVDGSEIQKVLADAARAQQDLSHEVVRRTEEQTAAILQAVADDGTGRSGDDGAGLEALRDHWWVQWHDSTGWVDLDPTLPTAEPGQSLVQPEATRQPEKLSDLGVDLLHRVLLKVVVETWKDGSVAEAPVMSQELVPAGLIGERIVLRMVPATWRQGLDPLSQEDPAGALKEAVLAQHEWLPVLEVGDARVFRYSFDDYGEFGDATLPGWAQSALAGRTLTHGVGEGAGRLGGRIAGMLGGAGQDTTAPTTRPQVTAVWIDYEIQTPGRPARSIRRQIFDLLGPAARSKAVIPAPAMTEAQRLERGLALMDETEILPLVGDLSPAFVDHLAAQSLLKNREALLEAVDSAGPAVLEGALARLSTVRPLPARLLELAVARAASKPGRAPTYLDRPNIFSYHVGLRIDPSGGPRSYRAFDIVANDVAVSGATGAEAFRARLEQGVIDTNLESLLLSEADRTVENTAEMFARRGSAKWFAVRDTADAAWQHLHLPADLRARMAADLAAGQVVLAPGDPIALGGRAVAGWWRVDPATGTTLGLGDRGWGQTATEDAIVREKAYEESMELWYTLARSLFALGDFVQCANRENLTTEQAAGCAAAMVCQLAILGLPISGAGPWAHWKVLAFLVCRGLGRVLS